MIVMKYKRSKKGSGWYSTHWDEDQITEMESQLIAQMFILKNKNQGYYEDLLLIFKSKQDSSYWEVTSGLKLQDFLNEDYIFGFINTGEKYEKVYN